MNLPQPTLKEDIQLFNNDLDIYTSSDEGKKVQRLLNGYDGAPGQREELIKSLGEYWDGRNVTALHYDGHEVAA